MVIELIYQPIQSVKTRMYIFVLYCIILKIYLVSVTKILAIHKYINTNATNQIRLKCLNKTTT